MIGCSSASMYIYMIISLHHLVEPSILSDVFLEERNETITRPQRLNNRREGDGEDGHKLYLNPDPEDAEENGSDFYRNEPEGLGENEHELRLDPDEKTDEINDTADRPGRIIDVVEYGIGIEYDYDDEDEDEEEYITDDERAVNDTEPIEYIPWDELHIVKIRTATSTGVRKTAGALVQDKIVVASCRCIKVMDEHNPISFPDKEYRGEDAIHVTRSVTGETRYVDRMTFGIRRYCINDPDTTVLMVLILTKPFHTEPLRFITLPTLHKTCRLRFQEI
uniref:Bifunctional hemolysin/adenylate cyclase n=1 Tax=Lygus hesperus TaxID=30085 RepID=A0A0A9W504_LYGHE